MATTAIEVQQGLNEVVMNKVQRMVENKAVGVQATMERLIEEGKIAQDYIAPLGVNLRKQEHEPVITFKAENGLFLNMPDICRELPHHRHIHRSSLPCMFHSW